MKALFQTVYMIIMIMLWAILYLFTTRISDLAVLFSDEIQMKLYFFTIDNIEKFDAAFVITSLILMVSFYLCGYSDAKNKNKLFKS